MGENLLRILDRCDKRKREKEIDCSDCIYIYILSKCLCQQKNVAKSFPDFLSNQ